MEIKVWKLYFFCDDSAETPRYIFDQVCLYSERDLRERLKEFIRDEQYGQGTYDFYELDKMTDDDIDKMSIDKIVDIFQDAGYAIESRTINI